MLCLVASNFQIKIDQINSRWKGTIILGVIGVSPNTVNFPTSAILLKRPCWIVTHDYININGTKTQSKFGECLENIQQDTVITLTLTHAGALSVTVGQKVLADDLFVGLPQHVYPIFDLYGKCERISMVNTEVRGRGDGGSPVNEELAMQTVSESGLDVDRNVPQGEKGDLEVHEKEIDLSSLPGSIGLGLAGSSNQILGGISSAM